MELTNGQYVIVSRSFGSYEVLPCTLETARRLLSQHEEALPSEIREYNKLAPEGAHVVTAELVSRAIHEACTYKEGAQTTRLRALLFGPRPRGEGEDTRPQTEVSQELQSQCILWKMQNQLNPLEESALSAQQLTSKWWTADGLLQQGLRARVAPKEVVFVDDWVLDMAVEYRQLKSGGWKDTAKEYNVVSRYLEFITKHLTHRDVAYEVAPFRTPKEAQ